MTVSELQTLRLRLLSLSIFRDILEEEPVSNDLEEAAKLYAEKLLAANMLNTYKEYSLQTQKTMPIFEAYDVEQAFEGTGYFVHGHRIQKDGQRTKDEGKQSTYYQFLHYYC